MALQIRRNRKLTRRTFRAEGRTSWEASYPNLRETNASDPTQNQGLDRGSAVGNSFGIDRPAHESAAGGIEGRRRSSAEDRGEADDHGDDQ